jgi:hypothetical protein
VESGRKALADLDALAAGVTLMALKAHTKIEKPMQQTINEREVQLKEREDALLQREKALAAREEALSRRLNEGERSV